jgi:hypothetical protein
MSCPVCEAAELLVYGTRELQYIYKGETTTIPAAGSMPSSVERQCSRPNPLIALLTGDRHVPTSHDH